MSNELRRLEHEIRDWTSRPPARSPQVTRTRVLARIAERRSRPRWKFAAAAAAMVVVLAFGLLLRRPETPSGPPKMAASEPAAPSRGTAGGSGLLVYELESGTKLYMALAATTPFAKATMEGN